MPPRREQRKEARRAPDFGSPFFGDFVTFFGETVEREQPVQGTRGTGFAGPLGAPPFKGGDAEGGAGGDLVSAPHPSPLLKGVRE
ncbi:MAG: hypothetical protein C0453_05235 [Comamonadaceae bacterium]|nr:hypothetical protein [Comamonadaceae bacterium]